MKLSEYPELSAVGKTDRVSALQDVGGALQTCTVAVQVLDSDTTIYDETATAAANDYVKVVRDYGSVTEVYKIKASVMANSAQVVVTSVSTSDLIQIGNPPTSAATIETILDGTKSVVTSVSTSDLIQIGNPPVEATTIAAILQSGTSTPTEAGIAKEVWLSVRTDGKAGTGTSVDPFDASTKAKFDALMGNFDDYTAIHLLPGTYETVGYGVDITRAGIGEWRFKRGWKVLGSGIGNTTVKLVLQDGEVTNDKLYTVFGNRYGDDAPDWAVVKNLTIDCNWQNQPYSTKTFATGATFISGYTDGVNYYYPENITLEDIHVINTGANSTTREHFVLCAGSANEVIINRCVVDQVQATGTGGGSIGMLGQLGRQVDRASITNCTVNGSLPSGERALGVGISADASKTVIANNFISNVKIGGPYHDSLLADRWFVTGNQYSNVAVSAYGLLGSGASIDAVVFSNNIVELQYASYEAVNTIGIALVKAFSGTDYAVRNSIIKDNLFVFSGTVEPGHATYGVYTNGVQHSSVENNVFDFPSDTGDTATHIRVTDVEATWIHNNHTLNGTLASAYDTSGGTYWPDN